MLRIIKVTNIKRPAIAMVELIFAIVVMGITLLSIPLMVNQASESTYTTVQQEAIAAAASDISLILSRAWDEQNTITSERATILTGTGSNYTQADRSNLRSRTYTTSTGEVLSSPSLGSDGDLDDVDDIPASSGGHIEDGSMDLIDTISISTSVDFLDDSTLSPVGTSATTSNIKGITLTLTSGGSTPELQKTIVLNAFSSNIGSYELERRVFP